ncbi:MAG: type II toxin-antitoxin system RelE/ParE family toxin [Deltaproteobacteria bacterium]|nr:type II toxin-antitoxin system RelE/ParE family toxin [Deltaproteobacteria bacterium]
MARFRVSAPAAEDVAAILDASEERWGTAPSDRYASLLAAAMQAAANHPEGPLTRPRPELPGRVRSIHTRAVRGSPRTVKKPVHVIIYRIIEPELVEIVRVLHECMDPSRHFPTKRRRRR